MDVWLRRLRAFFAAVFLAVAAVILYHLCFPAIYEYAAARSFAGDQWYDPYRAPDSGPVTWLRCNFHAHTKLLGGLANGEQSVPEMLDFYRARGYDVVGISNYQSIRPAMDGEEIFVPVYEHGYGARYHHQTVIGARRVNWLEYPLYQERRHKQHVLDALRDDGEFLVINHPDRSEAYDLDDMRALTGHHAVEICSRFAEAEAHWDAALTAGRPIWGMASDDCHNVERPTQTEIGWVVVGVGERTSRGVYDALRAGRFASVWAKNHEAPNRLIQCRLDGDLLRVCFAEPTEFIRFVGDAGAVRAEFNRTDAAEYRLRAEDTYVRIVAQTRGTRHYMNPVFRHAGEPFPALAAAVRPIATWGTRAAGLLAFALLAWAVLRALRSRRPAIAAEPVGAFGAPAEIAAPSPAALVLQGERIAVRKTT
ncbi:MAG: hypothetical protein L0Z55_12445 [Planctomycetes bacterium]|nr:hypothetical protein [Planctomycetota bacterium]